MGVQMPNTRYNKMAKDEHAPDVTAITTIHRTKHGRKLTATCTQSECAQNITTAICAIFTPSNKWMTADLTIIGEHGAPQTLDAALRIYETCIICRHHITCHTKTEDRYENDQTPDIGRPQWRVDMSTGKFIALET